MQTFPFQQIIDWHKKNARSNLPWREYSDKSKKELGYRVWLSEIILQQTQVSRGIEYFNKILKAFPTVEDLAHTPYEEFFEYYSGLGYYSRARNMLKTAIIITEEYSGIFPEETSELISLPGIGPYTAEAIRAFAYEESTLSFDTNLHKVFARFYYGNKFQKLTKVELAEIQGQFEKSGISGREINNALMDFATEFNTLAKAPNPPSDTFPQGEKEAAILTNYPLLECKYFKTEGKLEPIKARKQSTFPTKQAEVIIILHKDHKVYFSQDLDNYKPFHLGTSEINSRDFAKQHFIDKFNLEISVRPPHKKDFQDGKPYLVCYAQIQKGESEFGEFGEINKNQIDIHLQN